MEEEEEVDMERTPEIVNLNEIRENN